MIKNILHAFAEYKVLSLILLAAVVLMVFAWSKALRAAKKHNAEREAILAKLAEEKELRETYAHLTPALVQSADVPQMVRGIALGLQAELEQATDVNASFLSLPAAQQDVYALNFVFFEDADTLSRFFRLNGKPLTTAARDAAARVFDPRTAALFDKGYRMFDDADETTSALPADVDALDRAFADTDKNGLYESIRNYLAEQIENF